MFYADLAVSTLRTRMKRRTPSTAPLALAAFAFVALPAGAQTLSLAQRVARLEQQQAQQQQDNGGVGLVNQVQDLQSQIQKLQGQIEVLQHQLDQLQQSSKQQYVDLDTRVGKLEKAGAPAPAASSATAATVPSATAPAAQQTPTVPTAEQQSAYSAAFAALRKGDYVGSARGFRNFTQKYPDSPLAPNAYYWLGDSYYVTQNYTPALDAFRTLLKRYPQSAKSSEALLKVGYCQAEMKQYGPARATLEAVIKQYPGSVPARLAAARLREIRVQTAR